MPPPADLVIRLRGTDQSHLLKFWDELNERERRILESEIASVDFQQLTMISQSLLGDTSAHAAESRRVRPVDVIRLPRTDAERVARRHATELGESILAAGEVAVVLVAGGQGTRLGFDGPKGTFPIGPVSGKSLFQIHAEKLRALARRYRHNVPFYVMTSPENHAATAEFFQSHHNFGLEHLRLFVQGQMPAIDARSGRILLADKGRLALSPDGHGGTLGALAAPGPNGAPSCLREMADFGIRTLFYFQVDNPLVRIAEPAFLGQHRQANADVSFKVVEKMAPDEKVGVVVEVDGRPQVIEYSDLPPELAERRGAEGSLELWAGSIAIHVFERPFIDRLVSEARLPFHRALKKVKYIDDGGTHKNPEAPNAVKFERFIFDTLPLANHYAVVETDRATEFEPLKNATGSDSPATVRQRMSDMYAAWLEAAGANVVRRGDGTVPFGIEISPLFALDCAELKGKISQGMVVDGPKYLNED
jgi:UDP-N-acetylglucosamine/UDP-N-acetylgalactosamine diphosphorylase